MAEWINNIILQVDSKILIFIYPIIIAFFTFYLTTVQKRRRKIYLDFFYVEEYMRNSLNSSLQLGYIGAGCALLFMILYLLYGINEGVVDGKLFVCTLIAIVIIWVYLVLVYNNKKPEKYELREWRTKSREAQIKISIIRGLDRAVLLISVIIAIYFADSIFDKLLACIVVLVIFLYLDAVVDMHLIKYIIKNYTRDILYVEHEGKKYAVIVSNDKNHYCVGLEIVDGIAKCNVDDILYYPNNGHVYMKRKRIDGLCVNNSPSEFK